MPKPYAWTCGCPEPGAGEAAATRHAAVCELMGMPAHPTTCRVTIGLDNPGHLPARVCGEPAVRGALCRHHLAERERLL